MARHARNPRRSAVVPRALAALALVAAVGAGAAVAGTGLVPWPSGSKQADAQASPGPAEHATTSSPPATPTPTPSPTPTPEPDSELTIVATGDLLTHMAVNTSARDGDGYDFGPLLAPLDDWVAGADLALCHLEVPLVPEGRGPSGFPIFGAPRELAQNLADQGWDGCSTASNHSVDLGFRGVESTLDLLDEAGLGHVGTARSEAEGAAPQVYELERHGRTTRIAHLAATYGTNGMPVDADKPWSVQLIDTEQIVEQATAAREDGADLVLVSIHCCVEYVTEPTDQQVQIGQELADSGVVDLVIGHHAHVPQPVARLEGGPHGDGMWIAYGLGNFLSNQDGACCSSRTDSGLWLTAHVRHPDDGPARVSEVEWTAVTVDRRGGHRTHALAEIAGGAGSLSAEEVAARHGRVLEAAGDEAPERTEPTEATGPPPVVVPRPR